MKDAAHHLKQIQKKVVRDVRKSEQQASHRSAVLAAMTSAAVALDFPSKRKLARHVAK